MRARAEGITVGDLLVRAAEQYPDGPALGGLTFSALHERARGVARSLIAADVARYARVGVASDDPAERAQLMLGVALAGAVAVLPAPGPRGDVATTIGAGALSTDPGGLVDALELRRLGARLRDQALVLDGLALSHEAVVRTWRAWAHRVGLDCGARLWVAGPDPVLPWFGALLACLSAGARLVDAPAEATLGLLVGGSPVPDPPPATLVRGYGPVAASGLATATTPGEHDGGHGAPLPGVDVRIGDDGEILIRGYNLAEPGPGGPIDDRGWLHTGDRGRLDGDGRLHDPEGNP